MQDTYFIQKYFVPKPGFQIPILHYQLPSILHSLSSLSLFFFLCSELAFFRISSYNLGRAHAKTPLSFHFIEEDKKFGKKRNTVQSRLDRMQKQEKKIMMISKRNDEGHKSKTLIWTQREQKQHRHTHKMCTQYVPTCMCCNVYQIRNFQQCLVECRSVAGLEKFQSWKFWYLDN